jgi:hypothetical protein
MRNQARLHTSFLSSRDNEGDFLGGPAQLYAACLSSEGDQLSQWRGYAAGTGGYAIGIAKRALDHFTFGAWPNADSTLIQTAVAPSALRPERVSYDEQEATV